MAYVVCLSEMIFKKIAGKRATYFISLLFVFIFMLVSGASSSVIRAVIMLSFNILSNIFYKKSNTIFNISSSAVLMFLINPLIIYDIGFVLSFGGTFGIVCLSKTLRDKFIKFGYFAETLAVTCSAQIVLTPVMMYYFNTFSTFSVFANLIIVPISGSITILSFIIFLFSIFSFRIAKLLSYSLYILTTFTIKLAEIFSKLPFSMIKVITPNIFEIAIFYFIIFSRTGKILLPKRKYRLIEGSQKRISSNIIWLVVSIFFILEIVYYNFPKNYVEVNCIDVGQGDAFYIKTNFNNHILIDGGGSETYDVGQNILVPYLLDRRVISIDAIFISHSDSDHLNGILEVLEEFHVKKIFIAKNSKGYNKLFEIAKCKKIEICEISIDDKVEIDGLEFIVMWPGINADNSDPNEYSLVLKMRYGEKSMLFTGDIGKDTEEKLKNIKSDILKVGHHGSVNSSGKWFIERGSPSLSIISVGKENKYGHPNKQVVRMLGEKSIVLSTAECGEIRLKIYKNKIKAQTRLNKI